MGSYDAKGAHEFDGFALSLVCNEPRKFCLGIALICLHVFPAYCPFFYQLFAFCDHGDHVQFCL